jgi:Protein of unknown function (DUF3037)
MTKFFYSIVRVVPDPVRFEPLNVGVVVIEESGRAGDLRFNQRIQSRLAALDRSVSLSTVLRVVGSLPSYLGFDRQPRLGEVSLERPSAGRERLEVACRHLENQVQLSLPKVYHADTLEAAISELYTRYVSKRPAKRQERAELSAVEMRNRIWRVIKEWSRPNIVLERGKLLQGPETKARHPADFVFRNGVPRAAFFALAMATPDRATSFLYRDSLPTIAEDMGPEFVAYAVLPDVNSDSSSEAKAFVQETHNLLSKYDRVQTVALGDVSDLEDRVIARLL